MKLLFICSGNTCRSPMAMCLAQSMGYEARSAGLRVGWQGMPASDNALLVMKEMGLSLSAHRSAQVDLDVLSWADKIISMTPEHLLALTQRYPQFEQKTSAFPSPISDPYGYGPDIYRRTAQQIQTQLKELGL